MEYLVDPGVPVVSETGRRRRGYRGGRDHAIGTVAGVVQVGGANAVCKMRSAAEGHDSLAGVGREPGRGLGDSASCQGVERLGSSAMDEWRLPACE